MSVRHIFSDSEFLGDAGGAGAQPQLDHVCAELDRMASQIRRLARTGLQESLNQTGRASLVRTMLRMRRLRTKFLEADLFADPAWDVLLELKLAELDQVRISVSDACIAASVPATTALRWITGLVDRGLLARTADKMDARRFYLSLDPATSVAMDNYLAAIATELEVLGNLG